MTSTFCRL